VLLEFFAVLMILKALAYQVVIPVIITSIPLASIIAFFLSRFNKKLLENHPLKTYAVRFTGIFLMTLGLIKLIIG